MKDKCKKQQKKNKQRRIKKKKNKEKQSKQRKKNKENQNKQKYSSQKFISLRLGIWYQISNAISLLRDMFIFATLIAFRLKGFHCKITVKIFIHIKYVKNASHL